MPLPAADLQLTTISAAPWAQTEHDCFGLAMSIMGHIVGGGSVEKGTKMNGELEKLAERVKKLEESAKQMTFPTMAWADGVGHTLTDFKWRIAALEQELKEIKAGGSTSLNSPGAMQPPGGAGARPKPRPS